MLNFKKLTSTFIFSVLAFQSTAFAVTRYAKVVLLGGKGSGKTTIQKLINKDYNIDNIPHTTQISYISVPVFYDNKGNFTFDEDRDVQRYNKKVILNICDTPSDDDKISDYVQKFAKKGSTVLILLSNAKKFELNEKPWNFTTDYFTFEYIGMLCEAELSRKILILTHSNNNHDPYDKAMSVSFLKNLSVLNDETGFNKKLDAVKVLTLDNEINKENKEIKKVDESKSEIKLANNEKITSKEINLEYVPKIEEVFNKNNEKDLKEYADIVLNSIARSVYKYGIDKLPFNNNALN